MCERVNGFMSLLSERTKEVENGTDFLKHDLSTLNKVYDEFLICCREVFPDWADKFNKDTHFSFTSRLIDDRSSIYPILSDALFRFQCIDFASGYEYQQPYFPLDLQVKPSQFLFARKWDKQLSEEFQL